MDVGGVMIARCVVCSVLVLLSMLVGGCAGIDVVPLKPNGEPNDGQAHGFRYYMPKPYLLVTESPTTKTTSKSMPTTLESGSSLFTGEQYVRAFTACQDKGQVAAIQECMRKYLSQLTDPSTHPLGAPAPT